MFSSYKLRNVVSGYAPSKYTYGSKKWPLIQEFKIIKSQLNEYEDRNPIKSDITQLQYYELKKDTRNEYIQEIRMYSDRIDNTLGVTIKTCNKV